MKSRNDFKYEDDYKEYLRHYYAGLAMQGILSNPNTSLYQVTNYDDRANIAIEMADALIAHLSKE